MLKRFGNKRLFLSLFLILSLTLTGCDTDPVESDLLLPVDFLNIPDNMVLTDFHTNKIEIKIQALPKLIDMIHTKSIRYPVDLFTDLSFDPAGDLISIEPGEYLIPVEQDRIALKPGIRLLNIEPSYLSVKLEKKIRKSFKVIVPYIGQPANGYRALDAATEPARIELEGAFSLIQAIKELKTKPIDLTDADESFKKKIPLDLDIPAVVSKPGSVVIASVPIHQKQIEKTIPSLPIEILNTKLKVSLEPPTIDIQVKGPFETLGNREVLNRIYAFIDLKNLAPGVYARHIFIDVPVGLTMINATPQVFIVKIE